MKHIVQIEKDKYKSMSKKAKELIWERIDYLDDTSGAGNLEEHVYNLMGTKFYVDNIYTYPTAITKFFVVLTDPDFSKLLSDKMGSYNYEHLIQLLENFNGFIDMIKIDNFKLRLLIEEIEEGNINPERLEEIIDKYSPN